MNALVATGIAAIAVLCAPPLWAGEKLSGEERLAKLIEGKVAGEPEACIHAPNSMQLEVIDKTALVYKSGSTIYVNRPANAKDLSSGDVLVIDRLAHQLCKTDMVQTRSQGSMSFYTGSIFLGEFVPYRKAR